MIDPTMMIPVLDPAPPPLPRPRLIDSTDGVRLATYDLGGPDGAGVPLLFVHATGLCAGVWAPLAAELEAFHRVALDVRGHGRSSLPGVGMAWEGTADDVLATVDAFDLDRPVGVGHSMGGAALLLAEQARPGTFRSLWLFEPIVVAPADVPPDAENHLAAGARRRRDSFPSDLEAFENFAHKAPLDELDPACLAAYVAYAFEEQADGSVTLLCRPEVEAETFGMGMRHHAYDHLGEVTCPVVVVRGRIDGAGPSAFAQAVSDALPDGRVEDHPELGHFGPLEDPKLMARSVRRRCHGSPPPLTLIWSSRSSVSGRA